MDWPASHELKMIALEVDGLATTLTQAPSGSPKESGRVVSTGLLWGQIDFRDCVVLADDAYEFRN